MLKFVHLSLSARDRNHSRGWYADTLGMTVEFNVPERRITALPDTDGIAIFLHEVRPQWPRTAAAVGFRSTILMRFSPKGRRRIAFRRPSRKSYWGYGAEFADPNGYSIRSRDERSMKEK